MEINEPLLALLAAIFGGAGLKVIEALLSRSTRRADIAKEIRDELRDEISGMRDQIVDVDNRLDLWKRRYYELLAAFNELVVIALKEGLTEEVARIRKKLEKDDNVQD